MSGRSNSNSDSDRATLIHSERETKTKKGREMSQMRYKHERCTNVYPQICSQRVINWFVVRDHWQICAVPFRFFSFSILILWVPFSRENFCSRLFFCSHSFCLCAQFWKTQKLDKRNKTLMNSLHFHAREKKDWLGPGQAFSLLNFAFSLCLSFWLLFWRLLLLVLLCYLFHFRFAFNFLVAFETFN